MNADRLRSLADDWDRYEQITRDPEWRREMQRTVVVELEVEVARLRSVCAAAERQHKPKRGVVLWKRH